MHPVAPHYLFAERWSWTIIFWSGYAGLMIVSSVAHRRDRTGPRGDNRDRGSKPLIYVSTFLAFIAAFLAPSMLPEAEVALPHEPLFITAMVIDWLGIALYGWALLTLGGFFRTSVQLLEGQKLVTRGPYRLLRHPAYTGGILMFAGMGLGLGNWASALAMPLLVAIAYVWRIHVEEIALAERFGAEFEAHRKRTWAVIPLVW